MSIQNRILLRALNTAFSVSNHRFFSPIHQAVRLFYVYLFSPSLQFYIQLSLNDFDLTLICRNSAQNGLGFNCFASDIDYALIIPKDFSTRKLQNFVLLYEKLKRSFPFIGEIEIYTIEEWRIRQKLLSKHGKFIHLIYETRRLVWQDKALASAKSDYHRNKALNSIRKKLVKFGCTDLSSGVCNLKKISSSLDFSLFEMRTQFSIQFRNKFPFPEDSIFFSPYLEAFLTTTQSHKPRQIVLSQAGFYTLTSLLPDFQSDFLPNPLPDSNQVSSNDLSIIRELRKNKEIKAIYQAIALHELIIVHSVLRLEKGSQQNLLSWKNHLLSTLKHDPSSHFFNSELESITKHPVSPVLTMTEAQNGASLKS